MTEENKAENSVKANLAECDFYEAGE